MVHQAVTTGRPHPKLNPLLLLYRHDTPSRSSHVINSQRNRENLQSLPPSLSPFYYLHTCRRFAAVFLFQRHAVSYRRCCQFLLFFFPFAIIIMIITIGRPLVCRSARQVEAGRRETRGAGRVPADTSGYLPPGITRRARAFREVILSGLSARFIRGSSGS